MPLHCMVNITECDWWDIANETRVKLQIMVFVLYLSDQIDIKIWLG